MKRRQRRRRSELPQTRVVISKDKRSGRYVLRWRTAEGLRKSQVTDLAATEANRKQAHVLAAEKEDELQQSSHHVWLTFVATYRSERLPQLRPGTAHMFDAATSCLQRWGGLNWETDDPATWPVSDANRWIQWMRKRKLAPDTIRSYASQIRASLNWGASLGWWDPPGKWQAIEGAFNSRGRPLTPIEFRRMMQAAYQTQHPRRLRRLLRCLWLSGLRIGEAVQLSWDASAAVRIQAARKVKGRFWLVIDSSADKAGKDRRLPCPPEFCRWLMRQPTRRGSVVRCGWSMGQASRIVSQVGRLSGVKVKGDRTATAHDLRRSYGTRMAKRLKPLELQEMMRHSRMETTLNYYVQVDADRLAESVWDEQ